MINDTVKNNMPIPEATVFEHFDSLSEAVASGWHPSGDATAYYDHVAILCRH